MMINITNDDDGRWVAEQLGSEIEGANAATKDWLELQVTRHGHCARLDTLKESPTIDGYR